MDTSGSDRTGLLGSSAAWREAVRGGGQYSRDGFHPGSIAATGVVPRRIAQAYE
jgi:hypothetical protein